MKTNWTMLGLLALSGVLSACATTEAAPPTVAQRAACEEMAKMGEGATHNHSADKSGGVNTMAMTHAQCRKLLGS